MTHERMERLIEAAIDEYISNNYDKASLNMILKKAGISKGSFYHEFDNKFALYKYIIDYIGDKKVSYMKKAMEDNPEIYTGGNIFELLRSAGRLGIEFSTKNYKYSMLGISLLKETNKEILDYITELKSGNGFNFIGDMIKKGIAEGDITKDIPEDFITKMVNHLVTNFSSVCAEKFYKEEDVDTEVLYQYYEYLISFMEYGIRNRS